MDDAKKEAALKNSDLSKIKKEDLNPKADAKNFVAFKGKSQTPYVACGAKSKNKKAGELCHMTAGQGTTHVGYGRCKYHGGSNTGPSTPESKKAVSQNATKHGLYSNVLSTEERKIYEGMITKNDVGLEHEIYVLKTKILSYLDKWRKKWDAINEKEGQDQADKGTKVLYKESEGNSTSTAFYHAGTIEDKPLMRALETLARLVDKHAKLNQGSNGDSLVNQLNTELRAASYGRVSVSWGESKPQARGKKGGGTSENK